MFQDSDRPLYRSRVVRRSRFASLRSFVRTVFSYFKYFATCSLSSSRMANQETTSTYDFVEMDETKRARLLIYVCQRKKLFANFSDYTELLYLLCSRKEDMNDVKFCDLLRNYIEISQRWLRCPKAAYKFDCSEAFDKIELFLLPTWNLPVRLVRIRAASNDRTRKQIGSRSSINPDRICW